MLTETAIIDALRHVQEPELGRDIVTLDMVKDVVIDGSDVSLTIQLTTPACPLKDEIEANVHSAIRELGASSVDLTWAAMVRRASPAQAENLIPGVRNLIAVASGKGGVGKSTVAANFALALAAQGARAGLLDADIYGPSLPRMMGLAGSRPTTTDGKTLDPPRGHGLPVMSIGFLVDSDQPMAWRGPMVTQALTQMLADTRWGALDYLVVDMPPGTGDIQLTLTQRVPVSGAVIVTTPQEIALADARKGLQMFRKVGVPVLGIVENMGLHRCPACGHESHIFDAGGGRTLAERYETTLLGELPLDAAIRERADSGRPTVVSDPDSPAAATYHGIARRAAGALAASAVRGGARMPEIRIEADS
jgi:ATP-binding protein involved in chromosome partitioning